MKEKEQAEQPQQPPKQAKPKVSDQAGSTNGIPNWWIDNYTTEAETVIAMPNQDCKQITVGHLIAEAHRDITRRKGQEYSPTVQELQSRIDENLTKQKKAIYAAGQLALKARAVVNAFPFEISERIKEMQEALDAYDNIIIP